MLNHIGRYWYLINLKMAQCQLNFLHSTTAKKVKTLIVRFPEFMAEPLLIIANIYDLAGLIIPTRTTHTRAQTTHAHTRSHALTHARSHVHAHTRSHNLGLTFSLCFVPRHVSDATSQMKRGESSVLHCPLSSNQA